MKKIALLVLVALPVYGSEPRRSPRLAKKQQTLTEQTPVATPANAPAGSPAELSLNQQARILVSKNLDNRQNPFIEGCLLAGVVSCMCLSATCALVNAGK